MEETGKKSDEEIESLYVGSSALSNGASYLIVTGPFTLIIVSMIISINISAGMRFGAT